MFDGWDERLVEIVVKESMVNGVGEGKKTMEMM